MHNQYVWKIFIKGCMRHTGMRHTGLNGYVYDFSVYFGSTDVGVTLDINQYLMKKHDARIVFEKCLNELKKCLLDY